MSKCSRVVVSVGVAVLFATHNARARPPIVVDEETERRADELRRTANLLSREGRLTEALEAYSQAFSLNKTCATAANLGNLELKLERYRDAAEHLARALTACGAPNPPTLRQTLADGLAQATLRIGILRIRLTFDNAQVLVDGQQLDPREVGAVYLHPGSHTVVVSLNDTLVDQRILNIKAGAVLDVEVTQPSAPARTADAGLSSAGSESPTRSKSFTLLVTGFGVVASGLALGAAFTVGANNRLSQAISARDALVAQSGPAACAPSLTQNATACANLRGVLQDHAVFSDVAVWAFVAAGGAAAASATYAFWPISNAPVSEARAHIAPLVTPQGGGVLFHASF